jgi:hypothetical protein
MERLVFIFSIVTIASACKPTICETADEAATKDFNRGLYSIHSEEFQPVESTYLFVLRQNYNIKWYFTDSLDYYKCYDSTMVTLLEKKYSDDFLTKAKKTADSLDLTPNWYKSTATYKGDVKELIETITTKFKASGLDLKEYTKIFVQLTIDSIGTAAEPVILKGGLNKSIDGKMIDIIQTIIQPTTWTPTYLYGRPTKSTFVFPVLINYE